MIGTPVSIRSLDSPQNSWTVRKSHSLALNHTEDKGTTIQQSGRVHSLLFIHLWQWIKLLYTCIMFCYTHIMHACIYFIIISFFIHRRLTRGRCEGCWENEAGAGRCLQSRACHGFLHSISQNLWKVSISTHHYVLYKGALADVFPRRCSYLTFCRQNIWFIPFFHRILVTSLTDVTIRIVSSCKLLFCVISALTWSSSLPTRTSSDSCVHSTMSMWDRSTIPQSPPHL